MTCGCDGPVRTSQWTPLSALAPSEIQPGENIDCYARRIPDVGLKDDATQDLVNRIQNTSITADATLKVEETFTLSAGPRTATSWTMTPSIPGLTFNTATGRLSGTVDTSAEGQTFKVMIIAKDTSDIDSREFTFAPTNPNKSESLTFVQPYKASSGAGKINSGFGPRIHPITKAEKLHKGQDWVAVTASAKGKGTIVAVADGEVVSCGNDASGYGLNVRINHKAASGKLLCMTLYGHCSKILVSPGQKVAQGQSIALEGSTGASTGPHLHFEMRMGGVTPVDPAPYLNGTVIETPPIQDGNVQPADMTRVNTAPVMTANEVEARTGPCPDVIAPPTPATPTPDTTNGYDSPVQATCIPAVDSPDRLTRAQTLAKIDEALDTFGPVNGITEQDRQIILFIARIESGNDTYAKNEVSSALGLYQMVDTTAERYFGLIGLTASCENRVNPLHATHAMIKFYSLELKKYWTEYQSTGKIAGKIIAPTYHADRYSTLSQAEFVYGLIHHDGVGNAVKGIDKGGVAYFKKKAIELGFA